MFTIDGCLSTGCYVVNGDVCHRPIGHGLLFGANYS